MTGFTYETSGGYIRTVANVTRIENNKANTATRWVSEDGKKTYEWFWTGLIGWEGERPIFRDDVIRVSTSKSCSRFLGYHAKYTK